MAEPGRRAPDLAAFEGPWRVDPARTTVAARPRAMWLLRGSGVPVVIRAVGGEGRVHPEGTITETVTLDPAPLCTGRAKCDPRLRSVEFLDAQMHPTMVFEVGGGTRVAGGLSAEREFIAHGVTRPSTLHTRLDLAGTRVVATAEFELDSRQGSPAARGSSTASIGVELVAHFDQESAPRGMSWTHL